MAGINRGNKIFRACSRPRSSTAANAGCGESKTESIRWRDISRERGNPSAISSARNKYLLRYAIRIDRFEQRDANRKRASASAQCALLLLTRRGAKAIFVSASEVRSRRGYPTRNYGQLSLAVVHPRRTDASLEGSRAEPKKKKKKKGKRRRKTRSTRERSSK